MSEQTLLSAVERMEHLTPDEHHYWAEIYADQPTIAARHLLAIVVHRIHHERQRITNELARLRDYVPASGIERDTRRGGVSMSRDSDDVGKMLIEDARAKRRLVARRNYKPKFQTKRERGGGPVARYYACTEMLGSGLQCGKEFDTEDELEHHKQTYCHECDIGFPTIFELNKHLKEDPQHRKAKRPFAVIEVQDSKPFRERKVARTFYVDPEINAEVDRFNGYTGISKYKVIEAALEYFFRTVRVRESGGKARRWRDVRPQEDAGD